MEEVLNPSLITSITSLRALIGNNGNDDGLIKWNLK